jgi:putative PIN family toxin of toxin-antitoxin system
MRLVVDINVLARAHPKALGPARRLLENISRGPHVLIFSDELFQELERVLLYPRMLRRSGLTPDEIAGFLWEVIEHADIVRPSAVPDGLMRDPTDHHVIGTTLAGRADILCTNDLDFWDERIREFARERGIRIMSDLELLAVFDELAGRKV